MTHRISTILRKLIASFIVVKPAYDQALLNNTYTFIREIIRTSKTEDQFRTCEDAIDNLLIKRFPPDAYKQMVRDLRVMLEIRRSKARIEYVDKLLAKLFSDPDVITEREYDEDIHD